MADRSLPVRYAVTPAGGRVAYTVVGQGPAIVVIPTTLVMSNFQRHPALDPMLSEWRDFSLVLYDHLGAGLSQRDVYDYTMEGRLAELKAVVNDAGLDFFTLVGGSAGGPLAVRYAAENPQRVSALLLAMTWARGRDYVNSPTFTAYRRGLESDWRVATETIARVNQGRTDDAAETAAIIRETTDLAPYLEYLDALALDDVTDDLSRVAAPTLVAVNTRDDQLFRKAEFNHELAAGIRARLEFVDPESWAQASANFLQEVLHGRSAAATASPSFRTILFTDVVASTPLLAQLKDAKMREVMRDHDAILEAAVTEHGGRVIKTIGDAFMAEFAVPSAAVACAIAIQRGIQAQFAESDVPLRLRIGINAGEPVEEDGDLHGASVVIAKRLESAAAEGAILVSDVVKQAVAGKDFTFADQGLVDLKGFDEPVRAWSVVWA